MADQRWETEHGEYTLQIELTAWRRIDRECKKAHPLEIGGLLIGHYTADKTTAVVTEASGPPRDSRRGQNWFERGVAGLKNMLVKRWSQDKRTYYLGEWHYHPVSQVEPSPADITQMRRISEAPNYHCQEPIMVIVGQSEGETRPVRAFVFPRTCPHLEFQRRHDRE